MNKEFHPDLASVDLYPVKDQVKKLLKKTASPPPPPTPVIALHLPPPPPHRPDITVMVYRA